MGSVTFVLKVKVKVLLQRHSLCFMNPNMTLFIFLHWWLIYGKILKKKKKLINYIHLCNFC